MRNLLIDSFVVVLALLLAGMGQARSPDEDDDERERNRPSLTVRQARLRAAAPALQQPPHWSERSAWLRSISHWVSSNPEPHLRAIREIAMTELPEAADLLGDVLLDRDSPYRVDAAIALNRTPNERILPALIEVLEDPDPELRNVGARVLGFVMGGNDVAPEPETIRAAEQRLARLLQEDPEPRVRAAALHGLAEMGTPDALAAAFRYGTRDRSDLVRCGAIMRTGNFLSAGAGAGIDRRSVRGFLRKSLRPDDSSSPFGLFTRASHRASHYTVIGQHTDCLDVHEFAMKQLAKLRDPAALPALLRAAGDADAGLRASAITSLALYDDPKAFATVVAALADATSGVRQAAIKALGASPDPRADGHLAQMLRIGVPFDRRAAATALGGSFGSSEALIEAFGDRAVQVRNEAEEALLRSDELVIKLEEALARAAADASQLSEEQRLRRVGKLRDGLERWSQERREAERSLARGLASLDVRVRIRSARVLAKYQSDESLALLLESLRSGRHPESEMAALSLGLRGDARARVELERAALSEDIELAVAAIRALQDVGAPEALPTLQAIASPDAPTRVGEAASHAIAMLERRSPAQDVPRDDAN